MTATYQHERREFVRRIGTRRDIQTGARLAISRSESADTQVRDAWMLILDRRRTDRRFVQRRHDIVSEKYSKSAGVES